MKRLWFGFLILVTAIVLLLAQPTQAQSQCDPSYPDVCIAPAPPDLDCASEPYQNFRVLQPDPHGFHRDKDGIGCEA
jgi:micrococcal nuclease